MSWHKLVRRDDWGSITVHIGGPVVSLKWGTILDLKECPPVMKAGAYRIRWPNGKEDTLPVVMKEYTHTIGDMGHDYEVGGSLPYFIIKQNDATMTIPALSLEVEVWRDDG